MVVVPPSLSFSLCVSMVRRCGNGVDFVAENLGGFLIPGSM